MTTAAGAATAPATPVTHRAAVAAATGSWRQALWVTGPAALVGVALGLAAGRLERRLDVSAQRSAG